MQKIKSELEWKEKILALIQGLNDDLGTINFRIKALGQLCDHILLRINAIEDHLNINQPE